MPLNNLQTQDILMAYVAVLVFFFSMVVFGAGTFYGLKHLLKINNQHWENLSSFCVLGVAVQGLLALTIPLFGPSHLQFVMLWILFTAFFMGAILKFGDRSPKQALLNLVNFLRVERTSLTGYGVAVLFACTVCCLNITYPENLPDGPYVFKEKVIHNKIQLMTLDLPADNYVAFAFSDFFLRGISFREVRPLLPGQEVSNRPVLMGLVGAIYRKLFDRIQPLEMPLGEYEYLGTKWPAVGRFGFDSDYLLFLFIGIALNSLLYLPIMLIGRDFGVEKIAAASVFFMVQSPYFLSQTIFIWPKMMAGFFVLMGLREIIALRGGSKLVPEKSMVPERSTMAWLAILMGLAYHSHPVGVPYFVGIVLYLLYQQIVNKKKYHLAFFVGCYFLIIFPWLLWTKLAVGASANLLRQNLLPLYPEHPFVNFVWVRIVNLYSIICPTGFGVFPFNSRLFFADGMLSVFGAIGVLALPFGLQRIPRLFKEFRSEILLTLGAPFLLFWGVFTNRVQLTLHGLQPILALVGLLSFFELSRRKYGRALIFVQSLFFVGSWILCLNNFEIFDLNLHPENGFVFIALAGFLLWQWNDLKMTLSESP